MSRQVITIALSFVGLLVGAGFASGQEVVQYFISFGAYGLVGVIISGVVMAVAGAAIFQLGSYFLASEHNVVFRHVSHPIVSKFLDITTIITLFCIGFVMLAGAGSNLEQQFGWQTWIGSAIMTVLVLLTGFLDVDKVTNVISTITPAIIIAVFVALIYTVLNLPSDLSVLNEIAMGEESIMGNWFVSAINYNGLALMLAVSMILVIGGSFSSPKVAGLGGLLGGILYAVMLGVLAIALFFNMEQVAGLDMPLLGIFAQMHPAVSFVVAWIIYAMIYNTAIGMFYALAKRLTANNPERFRLVFFGVTIVGFIISFAGFTNLIGWVYPIIGWIGVLMILITSGSWIKGRARIRRETNLRERMTEIAEQHINPEEDDLTRKDRQELKELQEESVVDGEELWDTVQEEVAAELAADPEVDFTAEDAEAYLDEAGIEKS